MCALRSARVSGPRLAAAGPRARVQGPRARVQGPRARVQGPPVINLRRDEVEIKLNNLLIYLSKSEVFK